MSTGAGRQPRSPGARTAQQRKVEPGSSPEPGARDGGRHGARGRTAPAELRRPCWVSGGRVPDTRTGQCKDRTPEALPSLPRKLRPRTHTPAPGCTQAEAPATLETLSPALPRPAWGNGLTASNRGLRSTATHSTLQPRDHRASGCFQKSALSPQVGGRGAGGGWQLT